MKTPEDTLIPKQLNKDLVKSVRLGIQSESSIEEALTSVRKTLEFEEIENSGIDGDQIFVFLKGTEYRWKYGKTKRIEPVEA